MPEIDDCYILSMNHRDKESTDNRFKSMKKAESFLTLP